REILRSVERQLCVQARVDRLRAHRAEEQRVAVGRRARSELGRDIAARAGPVVDDDLLPPFVGKALTDDAREDVRAAPRRVGHQHAQRLGREVLRARRQREKDAGRALGGCSKVQGSTSPHYWIPLKNWRMSETFSIFCTRSISSDCFSVDSGATPAAKQAAAL